MIVVFLKQKILVLCLIIICHTNKIRQLSFGLLDKASMRFFFTLYLLFFCRCSEKKFIIFSEITHSCRHLSPVVLTRLPYQAVRTTGDPYQTVRSDDVFYQWPALDCHIGLCVPPVVSI